MDLGFIGTGTMGTPMVRCLLEAGHRVTVHDVRRDATATVSALGARWADDPRRVAEASEIVFTSLPGPSEVESVALDPERGLLAGLASGSAYVDMTSNAPDVARRIARACAARGVAMLDAPVSGRPPGMTIMVGGEAATLARCRPLLDAMGRNLFHVGPAGTGCVAKLVTQYLGYANLITAIEGMLIGAKAGLDLDVLARIVPVSAGASRTFDNIPRGVFPRTFAAGGTLDIVAKDVHLACELARAVGAPAHMGLVADDVYRRAQARGWGGEGFPVVARILEGMAAVELRGQPSDVHGGTAWQR